MWAAPHEGHNRIFLMLMVALISLAWLSLWILGRPPDGLFYNHHGGGLDAFESGGIFMLIFVAGWTLMVMAMMLPTSLPMITLFRTVIRQRRDRTLLTALLIVGYLSVWTMCGVLVYFGGWALYLLVERSSWLEVNAWVLGAGVLLLAGLYQFTSLKYKCLEKCRSPLSFVTQHWRGSHERSRSLRLGAHHGLFCVGCCWSLMLLMFLVGGVGSFGWMLILGAAMAVEKNVSWGRRIGVPLGVLLLGLGVTLGTASALQSFDSSARIPLASTNHSGVSGAANFMDTPGGVEVKLNVEGLPDQGAMYLAHIHPGTCADEPAGGDEDHAHGHHGGDGGIAGGIEYPLTPVIPNAEGTGSSNTILQGIKVAQVYSGGEFYVNVHAESPGSEGMPESVACGDLARK